MGRGKTMWAKNFYFWDAHIMQTIDMPIVYLIHNYIFWNINAQQNQLTYLFNVHHGGHNFQLNILGTQFTYLFIFTVGYTIASSGILLFTKINSHTYSAFTLRYTISSTRILLYRKVNSHTYLVFTLELTIGIYGIYLQTQFTYPVTVYHGIYNCNFWDTHVSKTIHIHLASISLGIYNYNF
ncbi:hypothetical protein Cgig2_023602 [Carnegiea gigantea]|uniref:Uncharacterized protein n=1 Tax=Carnegiea gigantea TaxID=171969 RepID=A0A9Q1KC68_9CARY|nr:hypothetical protein Cgig2_023602 [Carnegiea gigantea]